MLTLGRKVAILVTEGPSCTVSAVARAPIPLPLAATEWTSTAMASSMTRVQHSLSEAYFSRLARILESDRSTTCVQTHAAIRNVYALRLQK
jgi:hypothetical protein